MATPKANNDHFPRKHEILQTKFIWPNSHEIHRLDKIAQISCISRLQGPIPTPSQTKNLQLMEFRPTPAITHS